MPSEIVDFLLMDREFPRSIRFCMRSADESLHAITGSPMGSFVYRSEQVMGLLRAELDFTPVDRILAGGLHEYLDSLQEKMNTVDIVHPQRFCYAAAAEPGWPGAHAD